MRLTIVLTKEVESIEQAQQIYDWVKTHLEERPEIEHHAQVEQNLTILDGVPDGG